MKISAVQFRPRFQDIEFNFNYIQNVSKNTNADLICFPELAFSGYFFWTKDQIAPYTLDFKSNFISQIQDIASTQDKIILFGFPERQGKNFYNSCAILFPDSKLSTVYRKTHLFYRERFIFEPGNTGFFVVSYPPKNINLGTMICYDWRFPEAARTLALLGADLIACPSNLVTKIWHLAIPARAIENKVFFLVAIRIGTETNNGETLEFNGKSGVWHYNGSQIASAGDNEETIITAEIEPSETRNKAIDNLNDIFKDRRPEMYRKLIEPN
jgi:predicted amidohydrolase